jgi:ArsR family transcriptional regulator
MHRLKCAYLQTVTGMRDVLRLFKALSNETRLRILNLLLQRECCVWEVMQAIRISQTRASRNLGILYDTGLLKMRREGLWVLYSIDEKAVNSSYAGLDDFIRKTLANSEVAVLDVERLKRVVRDGVCPKCGRALPS